MASTPAPTLFSGPGLFVGPGNPPARLGFQAQLRKVNVSRVYFISSEQGKEGDWTSHTPGRCPLALPSPTCTSPPLGRPAHLPPGRASFPLAQSPSHSQSPRCSLCLVATGYVFCSHWKAGTEPGAEPSPGPGQQWAGLGSSCPSGVGSAGSWFPRVA